MTSRAQGFGREQNTLKTHHLGNVAFLRTRIELINAFFAPGEVDEIWLTFSDPQMRRENARLSSPLFLERYARLLRPGGIIHLKTDSRFLHEYTKAVCIQNGLDVIACTEDLYGDGAISAEPAAESLPDGGAILKDAGVIQMGPVDDLSDAEAMPTDPASIPLEAREVQTFYETIFRSQGYRINYIAFHLGSPDASVSGTSSGSLFQSPDLELFNPEYWRSIEGERQIFGHDTAETRRQKLKKESSRKLE